MDLHPLLPASPYEVLDPACRWFPADEALRASSYERLIPPLVAQVRAEVKTWRDGGYAGVSATSLALLRWWFDTEHLAEQRDGSCAPFRYYFAQREAVETVVWLYDVRGARDKFAPDAFRRQRFTAYLWRNPMAPPKSLIGNGFL